MSLGVTIRVLSVVLVFGGCFLTTSTFVEAAPSPYFIPSRTSGVAPLAVFFDTASSTAASTTDTAFTTRPFHDLDYVWEFDDPSSGVWTYGTASSSKNTARGPESAHIFETPGTYIVTLIVGNNTSTSSTSTTITVTDPDTVFSGANTICVADDTTPVAGVGGCPSGAQVFQNSDWDNAIANYASTTNKRVLFKRGDSFSAGSNASITVAGPLTIGAYGTGNLPLVNTTDTNVNVINISNSVVNDLRIMDLEISGVGASDLGQCISFGAFASNIAVMRVNCHDTGKGFSSSGSGYIVGSVLQENHIHNYHAASGGNAYWGGLRRSAIIGNLLGPTESTGEHVLRVQRSHNVAISNNTVLAAPAGKVSMTLRADAHTTNDDDTFYLYVSDNKIIPGDEQTTNIAVGPNSDTQDAHLYDIIIERNWIILGARSTGAIGIESSSTTVRNNLIDLRGATISNGFGVTGMGADQSSSAVAPLPNNVHFLNNTIYGTIATTTRGVWINVGQGATPITNSVVRNNLCYFPSGTSGTTCLFDQGTGTSKSYNSTDSQVLSTSPLFTNGSGLFSESSDFTLDTGSYALGTTTTAIAGVLRDFANTLRPSTPSIGAFDISALTVTTQVASSVSTSSATGNGTITATGGQNASGRGFVYGTTTSYGATTTENGSFGTSTFNGSISGLDCNTLYHYAAYATNTVGTSYGNDQTFTTSACADVTAPTSPSALTVSAVTTTSFTLSWTASTDAVGVTGYRIYRDGTFLSTTTATSTSVTGLSASTSYTMLITAYDAAGNTSASSTIATTTLSLGGDITSPVISEVTPVPTPSTDTTPTVTITTDEAGTITYGGSCTSDTTNAIFGSNTITMNTLVTGTYTNCTIMVTDASDNDSNVLTLTSFTITVASSGGGGGGGSSGSRRATTATTTATTTPTTTPVTTPTSSGGTQGISLTRDLFLGIRDPEVLLLQRFLNTNNFIIATEGPGSKGQETDWFGLATQQAVIKYQNAYRDTILIPNGLTIGNGYVGVATRAHMRGNTTSTTSTIAELLALLAQLQAQLAELLKAQGTISTPTYTFTRDLYVGIEGEDVRQLQKYLNSKGFSTASPITGEGGIGRESTYFGNRTQDALKRFQQSEGIDPTGYFGPVTRNMVNGVGR